jgi:dolichol-phosphate mannosyltransferase
MKTLALIPGLNVAAYVAPVIARVPEGEVDQVLVVDDGSTDGTGDAARSAGAQVIRHEQNRGVGAAIRTGIGYARDQGFEAVVVLNAIGKFDPAGLGVLLAPLREGRADLVQGSRFVLGGSHHGTPFKRRIGTRGYSLAFSALLGHKVSDASSGIRAFLTDLALAPGIHLDQSWLDRYELEPYLLWKAFELGFRVVEVPMTVHYPPGPRSGYTRMRPVQDWWHLVRPLITLGVERAESSLKKR